MTCIVGLVEDGRTYIAGDSAGVGSSYSLIRMASEKVFANGEFVFGFTTSFRMGQVLRYRFTPPRRHSDQDVMEFMVTTFMDALREAMRSAGFAKKVNEEETAGTFLVGFQGRLFRIEDGYEIIEAASGYDACGCAQDIARGSLFATKDLQPEVRIIRALEAADFHSAGVTSPFHVVSTGGA